MIDLRDKDATVTNLANIGSILALAAGLVLLWLPKPDSEGALSQIRAQGKKDAQKHTSLAAATRAKTEELHQTTTADTWSGSVQDVNATILLKVNALLVKHNLKAGTFRPQRASTTDTLNTLPYSLAVEGPYIDVVGFVRDLETPANKLAVSTMQIQSADINSDRVNTNLTLVAFLDPSYVEPKKPDADKDADKTADADKSADTKKEATDHA